jgi:hypothetical protein
MKYLTIFPMSGHWAKYLGGGIAFVALALVMVSLLLGEHLLQGFISPARQVPVLLWILGMALFIISFSKERVEDERVMRIRYTALRGLGMIFCVCVLSAFSPLVIESDGTAAIGSESASQLIMLLMIVPLSIYQIIFHIGLRLDPQWAYNDGSARDNFRTYKDVLNYVLGTIILLGIFFILISIFG